MSFFDLYFVCVSVDLLYYYLFAYDLRCVMFVVLVTCFERCYSFCFCLNVGCCRAALLGALCLFWGLIMVVGFSYFGFVCVFVVCLLFAILFGRVVFVVWFLGVFCLRGWMVAWYVTCLTFVEWIYFCFAC